MSLQLYAHRTFLHDATELQEMTEWIESAEFQDADKKQIDERREELEKVCRPLLYGGKVSWRVDPSMEMLDVSRNWNPLSPHSRFFRVHSARLFPRGDGTNA